MQDDEVKLFALCCACIFSYPTSQPYPMWWPTAHYHHRRSPRHHPFYLHSSNRLWLWISGCLKPILSSPKANSAQSSQRSLLSIWLLLLAGDVEVNSDPSGGRHHCGVCSRVVRSNSKAILCEVCYYWLHIQCIGLNTNIFKALTSHGAALLVSR